jgi:hypothetical protein
VSAATSHAPRFRPAGRSYRINGSVQRDTMRVDAVGGPATFALVGAPGFVTMEADTVLRIGATSTQPWRSLLFQVVATNAAARRDTMWCHVVDPSKPVGSATGVGESAGALTSGGGLVLRPCAPNPFRDATTIRFASPTSAPAAISIVDVAGRTLRRIAGEGTASTGIGWRDVVWDGRDDAGAPLPAGMYFVRVETAHDAASAKVLRLK